MKNPTKKTTVDKTPEFERFQEKFERRALGEALAIVRGAIDPHWNHEATPVIRAILTAIGKIDSIEDEARASWRERHPDSDDIVWLEGRAIVGTALWLILTDADHSVNDVAPESQGGQLFVCYAEACALADLAADFVSRVDEVTRDGQHCPFDRHTQLVLDAMSKEQERLDAEAKDEDEDEKGL